MNPVTEVKTNPNAASELAIVNGRAMARFSATHCASRASGRHSNILGFVDS
jgi:hypothetical protein